MLLRVTVMPLSPRAQKRPREDTQMQVAPSDTQLAYSTVVSNNSDGPNTHGGERVEGNTNDSTKAVINSDGLGWPGAQLLTSKIDAQKVLLDT